MISRYIFSKYKPRTPNAVSNKLPRNKIKQASDGQPATGSPKHIALMKIYIRKTKDTKARINPMTEIIVSGHVV